MKKAKPTSSTWSFYKGNTMIAKVRDDASVAQFVRLWLIGIQPTNQLAKLTMSVNDGEKLPITSNLRDASIK